MAAAALCNVMEEPNNVVQKPHNVVVEPDNLVEEPNTVAEKSGIFTNCHNEWCLQKGLQKPQYTKCESVTTLWLGLIYYAC